MSVLRSYGGIAAAALAGIAAVVANQDLDGDIVPFFVTLTFAGGLHAWATHAPFAGGRRFVAWAIAIGWVVAAVWIGGLLVMYQAMCACSYPPRPPEVTYLGLSATIYHLIGLYGGMVLIVAATIAQSGLRKDEPTADR